MVAAEKACVRARDLTRQLLTFSRGGEPIMHPSSVKDIVEEMVAEDPMAGKIYRSWSSFLAKSIPNQRITEQAFLATRR
jgi:TRAP-type mannitol/chloroaromatic compound transport system substrate-binding protein